MEFQWISLTCFREAARLKSIRKAAETLTLSPSSVHRQLIKLEEQVGSTLFERRTDGVRLTAAGEVFYRYVQKTHHELTRAMSEIDDLRGVRRGNVNVACEEGLAKDFVPAVLAAYRRRHPGVTFTVTILNMPQIVDGLTDGSFDVGVAFNPVSHVALKRRAQVTVPLGAVMLPGHRLARRSSLRLADLVGEALILADGGFNIRQMLDRQFGSSRKHLTIAMQSNSFEAMAQLVLAGVGVAIRATMGIQREVARGELVFVPISEPGFHMETIAVCTKSDRPLPMAAAILVEEMIAALGALNG
jgi:DNA-binding transcriptional LysR family regulator